MDIQKLVAGEVILIFMEKVPYYVIIRTVEPRKIRRRDARLRSTRQWQRDRFDPLR
jgi:hypothetical protein